MKDWLKNIKSSGMLLKNLNKMIEMKWVQMMNNIKSCVDGFILLKIEKYCKKLVINELFTVCK